MDAISSLDSTKGSGFSGAIGCGLRTRKSTSSSSRRLGATYLRCCRTKNPCNSKYSRTIVSLTAAMSERGLRRAKRGRGGVSAGGLFRAWGLDRRFLEHFLDEIQRHGLAKGDLANLVHEHEFHDAFADLLVVAHRLEEFFPLGRVQLDMRGQSGLFKQRGDPLYVALGQTEQLRGKPRSQHLADGDRFPVEEFAVAGNGFERVADGVPEIQNRAQTALSFVLAHHTGLDLTTTGHHRRQGVRLALEEFGHDLFEALEQFHVMKDRKSVV